MAYIVNSSPGAGLRFEPSASFPDARTALHHAQRLANRGMRLIKIRETSTGEVFDEAALRGRLAIAEGARKKE